MKAKLKIPMIVIASVLAAIVIAVVILCCITVRPFQSFHDYQLVKVTTTSTTTQLPDINQQSEHRGQIDGGVKKSGFTVMHAMLEFVYSYAPRFEKYEDPDSTEKNPPEIKRELTYDEVYSDARVHATDSQYVLEFWYATEQSITVEKESVKFDRMVMNLYTTNGEVQKITVYPYLSSMIHAEGNPEITDYRITPVILRLNTSPLFLAVDEIIKAN